MTKFGVVPGIGMCCMICAIPAKLTINEPYIHCPNEKEHPPVGLVRNSVRVEVLLSNHNSKNDDIDYVKWVWFKKELQDLVEKHYGKAADQEISKGPIRNSGTGERVWEIDFNEDHRGEFFLEELNKGRV